MRDYAAEARRYAEGVVANAIPACKWARLACARHLSDLARQGAEGFPYAFDEAKAARACRFVELLPHVKGEWARRRELLVLQPWQVFLTASVFGWVHQATGFRRFKTSYVEIPRKNAKSTLAAGWALYLLAADGEAGAEVYSAATTRDQARIVWGVAKQMADRTPGLRRAFGVGTTAHAVHVAQDGGTFKALSADDDTLDGLNVHGAIVDEIHAHKTRKVWDVLETGTGAREQPLLAAITTAGVDLAGIAYELRDYLLKVLEGVYSDETFFGIVHTVDDDDLEGDACFTSPVVWAKANPNLGVSVRLDDLERQAQKALNLPSARPNFLTKRLDVWVRSDHQWMDLLAWQRGADPGLRLDDFRGEPCHLGLDLASKVDINSLVRVFRRELGGQPHYYLFATHWLPQAALEKSANSQYAGWADAGRLRVTDGEIVDLDVIEAEIRAAPSLHQVGAVGYDPHQATQLAVHLLDEGLPMVEMRPTILNFSEPMKELEALALAGRVHHDGDPVLTWMVSNVVCHRDHKDNVYPRKERAENKIDGVVAALMALGFWLKNEGGGPDPYEARLAAGGGLLVGG